MAGSVKLKDIASELGVSVVTVSNALSGKKGVSESVREEILKTAERMGYDTSKYGRKDGESIKIGVIVSEKYLEVGTSFYWAMYQQVAYEASRKNGFTIFEILDRNTNGKSELPKVLTGEEIDGLLVIGWMEHQYIRRVLEAARVPVVLLDFYDEEFSCDAVMSNNYIGMYKATRYLLERGHQEIAFVGTLEANNNIMDRFYGFRKGMEEWGARIRSEWVIPDRDVESNEVRFELPEDMPTAFVCNSDFTAGILYDKLREKGYRIPEDISVTAYDNYLYGHPFANELTTYNVDMGLMAKTAVHILLKKIRKQDRHQGVRYIDSEMIERSSVKKLY